MFMLCRASIESGSVPRMKPLLSLALCSLAAFGCTTTDEQLDEQDVQLPDLNIVTGTLLVGGCTPAPSTIEVTAAQVELALPNAPQQIEPPVRRAQILATNDP